MTNNQYCDIVWIEPSIVIERMRSAQQRLLHCTLTAEEREKAYHVLNDCWLRLSSTNLENESNRSLSTNIEKDEDSSVSNEFVKSNPNNDLDKELQTQHNKDNSIKHLTHRPRTILQ